MAINLDPPRVVNVADLRRLAKRRLPRVVFDYIDGGADGEVTLRENCRAFDTVTFRPRCAVATAACDLRTTVLGIPLSMPVILAPVGSSRLFYPRGVYAVPAAPAAFAAASSPRGSNRRLLPTGASTTGLESAMPSPVVRRPHAAVAS